MPYESELQIWKIIYRDNLGRETRSERLLADNISVREHADTMCEALREKNAAVEGDFWCEVVPQDYVLYAFDPTV